MNQDIINQLKELFTPMASKIGESAEFGWEVVVRQQIAYGIIGLAIALIGVIVMIVVFKTMKYFDNYDRGMYVLIGVVINLTAIIGGLIHGILYLYNPHYYAIQFFINLVK